MAEEGKAKKESKLAKMVALFKQSVEESSSG